MINRAGPSFFLSNQLFAKPTLFKTSSFTNHQFSNHSRTNVSPASKKKYDPSISLYQYHICPFCNKVKALLSYAGVGYETVEVNPLTKNEVKKLPGYYHKVPIANINDQQFNGSDEIIQTLLKHETIIQKLKERWSSFSSSNNGLDPMTIERFTANPFTDKWTAFANDDLAPVLYPNICRSLGESYAAFGYVGKVDSFSNTERFLIRSVGSLAMYFAASKIKTKRNITDERQALDQILFRWESEALKSGSQTFSSGLAHPDMGDVAVFGTLFSIQGLEAHTDALENRGGVIKEWYERMESEVVMR